MAVIFIVRTSKKLSPDVGLFVAENFDDPAVLCPDVHAVGFEVVEISA